MTSKFGVDRARFLAVATALAGLASFQACTTTNGDDEPGDGGAAGTTSAGNKATAGSESSAGSGGDGASEGGSGGASEGGATLGGAGQGGATLGGAGQGGASEGGAGGAPRTCDDNLDDPPTCEGVTDACKPYCNAAALNLKTGPAEAAVTCLEADTTGNCDAGYGCLADATALGCGADVAATCAAAELEAACGAPDVGDPPCAQLLTGFNDAARASVIECLEGESCFSVYSCAEGFFFE